MQSNLHLQWQSHTGPVRYYFIKKDAELYGVLKIKSYKFGFRSYSQMNPFFCILLKTEIMRRTQDLGIKKEDDQLWCWF